MAKLIAVLYTPGGSNFKALRKMGKGLTKELDEILETDRDAVTLFALMPGYKLDLFKLESDGVEKLESVEVVYREPECEKLTSDGD